MKSVYASRFAIPSAKREIELDYLRLFACFLVILLHVAASRWHSADVNSVTWQVFNLYNSASRSCVPIFFMISGKLFLSKDEMPSLYSLFSKYVSKLVTLYLCWGILYAIDTMGFMEAIEGGFFAMLSSFAQNPKYHLWYLPSLVGVYCVFPIMWCVAKYSNGKYVGYACLMFLIFGILRNTVSVFFPGNNVFITLLKRFPYDLSSHSGYFLLGYYLSEQSKKGRYSKYKFHHYILAYLAVVLIATAIGAQDAIQAGKPKNLLYNNLALPACIEGIFLFLAFINHKFSPSERSAKIIPLLSRCTLFVYLFHPFLLTHFEIWFNLHTESFPAIFSVPVIAFMVYICCLCLALIVNKIPYVSKWLA